MPSNTIEYTYYIDFNIVTTPPSRRYDTLMLTKGQLNITQGGGDDSALINVIIYPD